MLRHLFLSTSLSLMLGSMAHAAPKVVTSIAPVHGLAAMILPEDTPPVLLFPAEQSPHHISIKPKQLKQMQEADLVIWISPYIENNFERGVNLLGDDTDVLKLEDVPNLITLPFGEAGEHDNDDHEGHDDHHADHGDDHHKTGHDDHDKGDHHEEDHAGADADHHHHDHHDHHHGDTDPHYWLEPENAMLWLDAIALSVSNVDPDNAELYLSRAEAAKQEIMAVDSTLRDELAPISDVPYLVYHSAYQYFETRYGLDNHGAVTKAEGRTPSPRMLQELKRKIKDEGIVCLFTEPQFPTERLEQLKSDGLRFGVLDPLGVELPNDATFYPALLHKMSDNLTECLTGPKE